ncbi:hypothetical protein WR25_24584 [Diploscapter pachys]|uniref:Uncharacterized protein n=1 Tax=Diploscapter pachys TaxID=2018661 RepID=A0A2A2JBS0_9BILA|nr:hypothetical protein WR25_24584 [Diploscapter pachys]
MPDLRNSHFTNLLPVDEGVAADGHQSGLLGVEDAAGRVDTETPHVGGLDRPADATSTRVDDLQLEDKVLEGEEESRPHRLGTLDDDGGIRKTHDGGRFVIQEPRFVSNLTRISR